MDRMSHGVELLDGSLNDPGTLIANLSDMARLNRMTGGRELSVNAMSALGGWTSILDVGTGAADFPMTLIARAYRDGRAISLTASDSRPEVIDAVRSIWHRFPALRMLTLAVADARQLPWPDGSFDVVHTSMVIHHLDPDDAIAALAEMRRVSRRGVVVNDLLRGRAAWIGAWVLIHALRMSRYTRHDGPLSVRRAYTLPELNELLREAGMEPVHTFVGFAGHRVAIAAR
jgi:ubiquinone/menaquinone biosynthesis C-methylase UbiE